MSREIKWIVIGSSHALQNNHHYKTIRQLIVGKWLDENVGFLLLFTLNLWRSLLMTSGKHGLMRWTSAHHCFFTTGMLLERSRAQDDVRNHMTTLPRSKFTVWKIEFVCNELCTFLFIYFAVALLFTKHSKCGPWSCDRKRALDRKSFFLLIPSNQFYCTITLFFLLYPSFVILLYSSCVVLFYSVSILLCLSTHFTINDF